MAVSGTGMTVICSSGRKSRREFWRNKITRNKAKDAESYASLKKEGWYILTIWECALKGRTRRPLDQVLDMAADWLVYGSRDRQIRASNTGQTAAMKRGFLSEYFEGVAVKRLSAVEADPAFSNQHEFNGVSAMKKMLGTGRQSFPARFAYLGEDEEETLTAECFLTWYDAREAHPTRSEYRLYFPSTVVMERAAEGDLMVIGKRPDGTLSVIIAMAGSTAENQLKWLFGVPVQIETRFEVRTFEDDSDVEVNFAARFILEELGVEVEEADTDRLDSLVEKFNGVFPSTAIFSAFARDTLPEVDPREDPDAALLAWMEQEEKLFRRLENQVVSERLKQGFRVEDSADVDAFISYSLSVQNRRKSRAGYALEHHLDEIFRETGLRYDRQAVTENNAKPDFLFPGVDEYQDETFPSARLFMLGVKTTCKDRWRQVLSEAKRIKQKHLLTLEPAISTNQTAEMGSHRVQLVMPSGLHNTYTAQQQAWLFNLKDFIGVVRERQTF